MNKTTKHFMDWLLKRIKDMKQHPMVETIKGKIKKIKKGNK